MLFFSFSCSPCPSQSCLSQFSHHTLYTNIEGTRRRKSVPIILIETVDFIAGPKRNIEFQLVILQENDLPRPLPIGLMLLISLVQQENLHYETGNCLSPAHRFRAFPLPLPYSLFWALLLWKWVTPALQTRSQHYLRCICHTVIRILPHVHPVCYWLLTVSISLCLRLHLWGSWRGVHTVQASASWKISIEGKPIT